MKNNAPKSGGVTEIQANEIKVYPNPTLDHLYIDNGNYSRMAGYSIEITNSAIQTVFQSLINQPQFYLDLASFGGNGVYLIFIYDPLNQLTEVRKIVLQ